MSGRRPDRGGARCPPGRRRAGHSDLHQPRYSRALFNAESGSAGPAGTDPDPRAARRAQGSSRRRRTQSAAGRPRLSSRLRQDCGPRCSPGSRPDHRGGDLVRVGLGAVSSAHQQRRRRVRYRPARGLIKILDGLGAESGDWRPRSPSWAAKSNLQWGPTVRRGPSRDRAALGALAILAGTAPAAGPGVDCNQRSSAKVTGDVLLDAWRSCGRRSRVIEITTVPGGRLELVRGRDSVLTVDGAVSLDQSRSR